MIALRLVVADATDGLLDLVKLVGDFRLGGDDGAWKLEPRTAVAEPAPWTTQGFPFLSGAGIYRTTFTLPGDLEDARLFVEADAGDDALEVRVNGASAGVRLWPPYGVEITELATAGENRLELRIANTAANLLSGIARPSGLRGAPQIVFRRHVDMELAG